MAQTPEGKVKDFVKKILKRYKDDGQGVYAHCNRYNSCPTVDTSII